MGIDAIMTWLVSSDLATDDAVARWSWRLAAAFGHWYFATCDDEIHVTALEKLIVHDDDMPNVDPNTASIAVRIWQRWYGPGYSRGDICFMLNVAEFLRGEVPGSRVLYANDSRFEFRELDTAYEAELLGLFQRHGRYYVLDVTEGAKPCAFCKQPITGERCPGCADAMPKKSLGTVRQLAARIAALSASNSEDVAHLRTKIHALAQMIIDKEDLWP